jgi:tetratricopeptide (TPR) repeat protein
LINFKPLLLLIALCFLALTGCEEERGLDPRERAEMQSIFSEARKLDDQGRYHEALVRYESILARHPTFMSTRLNAAMAAYDSGQYAKSRDHFEVLHKYGPGDWFVVRKLIQCSERLGNDEAVKAYRKKLDTLRAQKDGSPTLKKYEGLTRDFIPIGTMHLIGYEFFEPKKHGRLWFFKLEDKGKNQVSAFLLQSTPFFDNDGRRLFSLTEASYGWLKVWHVGTEGRDYKWSRDFVIECLQGKRQPLVVKPLPPEYDALNAPGIKEVGGSAGDPANRNEKQQNEPAEEEKERHLP